MINKYKTKHIRIRYYVLLFTILLMGYGCQIQIPFPEMNTERSTHTLTQKNSNLEWTAPRGCTPISISLNNVWGVFYCEQQEQLQNTLSPGVWVEKISDNTPPVLLMEMVSWPNVSWSPNGQDLVITNSREDVWLFHVDTWEQKQLLYEASTNTGADGIPLPHGIPSWSPDSTHLAMLNPALNTKLMLLKPNEKIVSLLNNTNWHDTGAYLPPKLALGPTWSANSKKIAFLTVPDPQYPFNRALWIWDRELGDYEVAFDLKHDPLFAPVWSPDGQVIAFSGVQEIVFYNLAEKTLQRISLPNDTVSIDSLKLWDPDSSRLIIRVDSKWWLLTLTDKKLQQLDDQYLTVERWTHDGLGLIVQIKENQDVVFKSIALDME